jgi:hypothetical protein
LPVGIHTTAVDGPFAVRSLIAFFLRHQVGFTLAADFGVNKIYEAAVRTLFVVHDESPEIGSEIGS